MGLYNRMAVFRNTQAWVVPDNFNNLDNQVWLYGAGGDGVAYNSTQGGGGGGGGACRVVTSPGRYGGLTADVAPPGETLTIQVGLHGTNTGGPDPSLELSSSSIKNSLDVLIAWGGGGANGNNNLGGGGGGTGCPGGFGGNAFFVFFGGSYNAYAGPGGGGSGVPIWEGPGDDPNYDTYVVGGETGATIGGSEGSGGGGGAGAGQYNPIFSDSRWDDNSPAPSPPGGGTFGTPGTAGGQGGDGPLGTGHGVADSGDGDPETGGGGAGGYAIPDGGDGASWDYILSVNQGENLPSFSFTRGLIVPDANREEYILASGAIPGGGGGGGSFTLGQAGNGGYPGGGGGGAGNNGTPGVGADGLVIIFWNEVACGTEETPCEEIIGDCGDEDTDTCVISWPSELAARTIGMHPVKATLGGGAALPPGQENVTGTQNGFWRFTLSDILITSREQVLKWRQMEVMLEGRANAVCVSVCEGKRAPWETVGSPIIATANSLFTAGHTAGEIKVTSGGALRAGMHFSTGERLYRIKTVGLPSGSPPVYPVSVWPTIRTTIDVDTELEFVNLSCKCRLVNDDGMSLDLDLLRYANASVMFEEDL